jgi:ABC-type transporter MlaC component
MENQLKQYADVQANYVKSLVTYKVNDIGVNGIFHTLPYGLISTRRAQWQTTISKSTARHLTSELMSQGVWLMKGM